MKHNESIDVIQSCPKHTSSFLRIVEYRSARGRSDATGTHECRHMLVFSQGKGGWERAGVGSLSEKRRRKLGEIVALGTKKSPLLPLLSRDMKEKLEK